MRFIDIFLVFLIFYNLDLCKGKENKMKTHCFGSICEKSNGKYPTKMIKSLLKKHRVTNNKSFGKIMEPAHEIKPTLKSHLSLYEENLCESQTITTVPKYDNKLNVTIVNVKAYKQHITFEKCLENKNGKCHTFFLDYNASCKQLYNKVQLLYVDKDNKLAYGLFTVPNVCVCVCRKTNNFTEKNP